ncbi:MAG: hypothetical protein P4L80_02660 [Xanthobacteraceae bacterium]|nr:hypothetical protein [Xanthobacteraceae bacterium]
MSMLPAEISSAMQERGRLIWNELLLSQCTHRPLPFVQFDPTDPAVLVSAWNVANSGDEVDDLIRGVCYAELLVHCAKTARGDFDPFQVIQEVMVAIAKQGDAGAIARGFFARIAILALAASLN